MEADTSSEVLVILAIMTCFVVLPFLFKPKTNGVAANGGAMSVMLVAATPLAMLTTVGAVTAAAQTDRVIRPPP